MAQALEQAEIAASLGEVPVGAVLVSEQSEGGRGVLLAKAHNQPIGQDDPTAHAETIVLRKAAALSRNYRLPQTTLYTTLEPCLMCAGAMVHARVQRLVYGATEPKAGVVISHPILNADWLNHQLDISGGVLAPQCSELLTNFFREARNHAG